MKLLFGNVSQINKVFVANVLVKIIDSNFTLAGVGHNKHRNGASKATQAITDLVFFGLLDIFDDFGFLLLDFCLDEVMLDDVAQSLLELVNVFDV